MHANSCRVARTIGLLIAIGALDAGSSVAVEPVPTEPSAIELTHVVVGEAAYYTTGPQQGRPPDGTLQPGTKVKVLRTAGSYAQVQASSGVVGYVARDALREVTPADDLEVTDDVRAVARSNNEFTFDLFHRLRDQEGNLFFSPASISTALAMTYAGAEGPTEQQMARTLHFDQAEDRLHIGFGTLTLILNSRVDAYQLTMANRLWGAKTYTFRPEYLAMTRQTYAAELAPVDFTRTEAAREQINTWVAEQTRGKIEQLIPAGLLDADTRLVLTNAVYFKGAWDEEFSERRTQDAPFHVSPERQLNVPTMHQTDDFRYAETADLQVLELPYAGKDLSMIILLPKEIEGLAGLHDSLTMETWQKWLERLTQRKVEVHLPKFTLSSQFRLANVLRALGMSLAFSSNADFSGISTAEDLMLSEVIHRAFVDVNEQGTEAAAATAVLVEPTAAIPTEREEPVVFRADHPFVFLIRDNRTEAVLFAGRVSNPVE